MKKIMNKQEENFIIAEQIQETLVKYARRLEVLRSSGQAYIETLIEYRSLCEIYGFVREKSLGDDCVRMGDFVTVMEEGERTTYQLVKECAGPCIGQVSLQTEYGRTLLGSCVGDVVSYMSSGEEYSAKVLEIVKPKQPRQK